MNLNKFVLLSIVAFLGIGFVVYKYGLPWNNNSSSCLNGDIEGICTCPEGKVTAKYSNKLRCFDRSNSCPSGYIGYFGFCNCFVDAKDSEGSCVDICSNCNNGWCSSAEKCVCNQGFKMSEDNKCEPICESSCPEFGFCKAPGVCSCNKGYTFSKNKEKCEPFCSKNCTEYSYCSAPEVCTCLEGYNFSDEICEPICSECPFELPYCSKPGVCSCMIGYTWSKRYRECVEEESYLEYLEDEYGGF